MSGLEILVATVAGFVVGAAMRVPVNNYLARLRAGGLDVMTVGTLPLASAGAVAFGLGAMGANDGLHCVPILLGATGLVGVAATDLASYRIANRILFPAIAATATAMTATAMFGSDTELLGRAAICAGVFAVGFYAISALLPQGGLGMGDVKLSVLLGLMIGWVASDVEKLFNLLLYTTVLASVLGIATGMALEALHRRTGRRFLPDPDRDLSSATDQPSIWRNPFPFGPSLAAATMVIIATVA